ncbi:CHAP domain-containing protein [Conexibacter sp. W3-3-2]|uniref:CHAP domain-containing protein n=1 Tax=Conexibacter sp. W3-3-2 TaxID=2675227 RepID=UPI0018AA9E75|nr:CHAP domain-containing protein [Conexibacter sp. W3-3-2]
MAAALCVVAMAFLSLFGAALPAAVACSPMAQPTGLIQGGAIAETRAFRTLSSGGAVGDIPPAYAVLYQRAAAQFGLGEWATLAAVGSIETDHGRSPLPGVHSGTNSAGAAGPMQFIRSTWAAYGVDGNGDGLRDIYDPQDAIPGAARYLRASGAPGSWQRALFAYNHAQWYVDDVLARAREYRALGAGAVAGQDAQTVLASCTAFTDVAGGSELGGRIVAVARGELGERERPLGSNCTKYNAPGCYAWCSAFTTWVWQKAGVRVPIIPCSGNVLAWAAANGGKRLGPDATPSPGDAIVYGTGPTCPASVHIGLVEQVLPDGRITTIEGNGSDSAVSRKAPFLPARAQSSGRPGPVFGYARPPGGTPSDNQEAST